MRQVRPLEKKDNRSMGGGHMGWRFRKIFSQGPFRITWTGMGMGWSVGIPGFRYGVAANGRRYVSVGFPGTGLYYVHYLNRQR
jgi:hypothetical protein